MKTYQVLWWVSIYTFVLRGCWPNHVIRVNSLFMEIKFKSCFTLLLCTMRVTSLLTEISLKCNVRDVLRRKFLAFGWVVVHTFWILFVQGNFVCQWNRTRAFIYLFIDFSNVWCIMFDHYWQQTYNYVTHFTINWLINLHMYRENLKR